MRKWMQDRLKRRKKPAEKGTSEPAPAPLQPAYFEAEAPASLPEPEQSRPSEAPSISSEREEAEEARPLQPSATHVQKQVPTGQRRRRRRGGRGRGRGSQPGNGVAQPAPQSAPQPQVPARPAASGAPKGTVVLAIGLPGSGKSSWFKRNNITPLSSDLLLTLQFDDATEQRFQDLVFSNLRSMLKARLIARRPLNYVDATNLTPNERHSWIKLAKDFGYEVQAVYFDVPVEVCLDRNRRRERVVDEDVMRRMAGKMKPPTFDEGFAKITVVKVKRKDGQAEAGPE